MRISQCYRRMARSVRVVQIGQPMRALLLGLLIWTPGAAPAQEASPYVPLQHWAMPYVEHLIATGVIADPTPLTRPFSRGDLAWALRAADTASVNAVTRRTLRQLLTALADRRPAPPASSYRIEGAAGVAAATHAFRDPL